MHSDRSRPFFLKIRPLGSLLSHGCALSRDEGALLNGVVRGVVVQFNMFNIL